MQIKQERLKERIERINEMSRMRQAVIHVWRSAKKRRKRG